MDKEITYIPYGQDEISQQDLMTSLANGVPGYLDNKRWAKKDKYRQAWLNAYQDIINGGLVGASNSSGIWTIQHGGEPIDLSTKSNLDREMYQDAAYYIQQQMSRMTPRKKEEETKKDNLEQFNFQNSFGKQLLNLYGGDSTIFENPEQGWNSQDVRGENGLRGTSKRRETMAKQLELYKKDLEGKDYNFEGTSFKDKQDALTKIQTAIDALRTTPNDESDDLPAFSALGLNYRGFFSNGGNEASTHLDENGNPYTWNQWNEYQQQQATAKVKQDAEKLKQQRANQWKSFRTLNASHLAGRPLTAEESNAAYLDNLFAKGKWTGDEQSQIVTAFKLAEKNGQLVGLSKEELAKLPSTWKNRGKYLKRINGLSTPLYYDSLSRQFKLFNNNDLNTKVTFQDVLDKNNPTKKKEQEALTKKLAQDKHLANTEWWNADQWRELGGIAADVASVINPEPISAGIMALGGTGLRTWNKANDPDGFTWGDAGETAVDAGLSLLGMIPVVGDAALSARIIGRLQKIAGWVGVAFAAKDTPEAAKEAWNLIRHGQNPSVEGWRAIGNVLMGLTQARRIQLNRAAGRQVQQGNVNEKSPLRIRQIAKRNPTNRWNMRTNGDQQSVKGPWYKKAWNYFKDPYKPMETPKVETSTKTSQTTAESARKIKESMKKKLHRVQDVLKKKVSKEEMGGTINNTPLDNIIEDFFKNNNI